MRNRWTDRFGGARDADPLASMASLVDVMLVFACGLIAALVAGGLVVSPALSGGEPIQRKGREVPEVPDGVGEGGSGSFESVGRVYRDPKTGRLFLLEEAEP